MPGATIIGNAPFTAADHVKLEDLPLGPLISVHVDLYLPYLLKGISIKTFVSKNLYIGTLIYIYIYIYQVRIIMFRHGIVCILGSHDDETTDMKLQLAFVNQSSSA